MRKAECLLLAGILCLGLTVTAHAAIPFTKGDIFVGTGGGFVQEFTPTGILVQTLDTGCKCTYTGGMAFDSQGNLYVTNFGDIGNKKNGVGVAKFDKNGNLINTSFIANTYQESPESISFAGGQFPALVGDGGLGFKLINAYDSSGVLTNSYSKVDIQNEGTDFVELLSDGKTVLYTSEGDTILSYDISLGKQNPPFATGLNPMGGGTAFEHRQVLTGPYAGDILVADNKHILLVGPGNNNIVKTYAPTFSGGRIGYVLLSMDGKAFWTADYASGYVWEIDIAAGTELQRWKPKQPNLTYGIAIYGEQGQNNDLGYLEICKASDSQHPPPPGYYDFTATAPFFDSGTIEVPLGQCSGSIQVPSGAVTVTEKPTIGVAVSDVTAIAFDGLGYRHDELNSWSIPDLHALVNVMVGDVDEETLTTFTNYAAPPGIFKLCKIAGDQMTDGQPFTFTVIINNQSTDYTIMAGPLKQGGTCVIVGSPPVNTPVQITEHLQLTQFFLKSITVNEGQLMACTPPSDYCTIATTIPGITEVDFTNIFLLQKRCMECENLK